MKPIVISIDELKELFPGYTPEKAAEYHIGSDKLANSILDENLREIESTKIVLMCGGSASGKTEFISEHLSEKFNGIIYDSTLSTVEGARVKVKKILKSRNIPVICFLFPHCFKDAFAAFKIRERKIPENRFYETHSGSRKVVLWVAKHHEDIETLVYESYYVEGKSKLDYYFHSFDNNAEKVSFFENIQYNEEEIFNKIKNEENQNNK